MCVGHLLLILTMLCGIIAYPATPNAQRHVPHMNRDDIDLDQSHANRIVDDDFNHYRYQQARERMAQQEHGLDTRYDNDDGNEDDPPRRVSYPRYFNHEDEVDDDDEHQGFGKRAGGPSLSIVNPLDVLRQRLQLEMARRKQKENLNRIESNAHLFNSIGKRSTRQEAPPRPPMVGQQRV